MNPFDGLRRNTAINLVGSALPLVVSLATVPFYIRVIGPERYGVLLIVWALLGYFGAFDLGLSRAVANKIAQLGPASSQARSQVVWTGLFLSLGVGLVGGAAMAGAGYLFTDRLLNISPELRHDTVATLIWLGAAVPLSNAMWLLIGSLEGQERFVLSNSVTVVATAASQAVPLVLGLLTSSSLLWMLVGVAVASLLGFLTALAVCVRAVPLGRIGGFDRSLAIGLARYGGWVMVTGFVLPILSIADRLVIGAISGVRAVTVYTVPYNLVSRIGILPLSVARTLFPRFSLLSSDAASQVQQRAVVALTVLLSPLSVVGMFMLEPFLQLWVGGALAPEASRVGQIVLLGVFANAVASVPYTYLQGQGRPDLPAKFHLLELVPYLAMLWAGLRYVGIEGAAWATTARMFVDAILLCRAAALPRRALGVVVIASLPVVLAYVVVIAAGHSDLVRAFAGAVITAVAIVISLRLRGQMRGGTEPVAPAPKPERLAGAQAP
jgi:O-antigen/teichoic acid export membrane protein